MSIFKIIVRACLVLAPAAAAISCANDPDQSEALGVNAPDNEPTNHDVDKGELNLSIMNPVFFGMASMLKDISTAVKLQGTPDISYPVCLYGNYQVDQGRRAKAHKDVERVLNRWSDALKRDPSWPVKSIRAELVGSAASCPFFKGGVRVLKIKSDIKNTRAFANIWFSEITSTGTSAEYYPYNFGDKYFYIVMLHEVGHLLGLGDAYSEAGYQTPYYQPDSIMNSQWNLSDLTEDDTDAINHVWQRLRGRTVAPCPGGYVQSGASSNTNQNTFCIKAKSAGSGEIRTFAGKCLTLKGAYYIQADCNGDKAQRFNLSGAENGSYQIQSQQNGQCLDIELNLVLGGAKLRSWPCHGGYNQQFRLQGAGEGGYQLIAQHSQKCVDIAWESPRSGAAAIQWQCLNKRNQQFGLVGFDLR